ncbi:MAG TPA: purine-nucleoside phosphorylase [Gemmatimonadaceae bacterium]|nr:purine-nucleoside phosphorylase [Gemmatimonadaceae bacterium]
MIALGSDDARRAADVLRDRLDGHTPEVAIVLGSGLGELANRIDPIAVIPFGDVPEFPSATVAGHAGKLVVGRLQNKLVAALAGRFHVYEGHDIRLTAFPTRVVHALGARTLIVSNAAGGINRLWRGGDLMVIRDHINLMFRNPLIGAVEPGDLRFPDMSEPYDAQLASIARAAAEEQGVSLREGVYAALTGPAYETPAEVRMLGMLGADAVGMSTVPEVIVARALGMRVLGLSCITNLACGLSRKPITHADVLETTARAAERFQRLVIGVVGRL